MSVGLTRSRCQERHERSEIFHPNRVTGLDRRWSSVQGQHHRPLCGLLSDRAASAPMEENMTSPEPAADSRIPVAGRPLVFRRGTVLTMDDARQVLTDGDVLVVDDRIAAVGANLDVPDGTQEIDASRRHRHAGHDRHPPAHVADRHARLRRRLDPDPVFRLVLPRARSAVPAAGCLRGQPAVCAGGARGGCDHHRRLVARAADGRARGGRRCRLDRGSRPVRAGLRQHPGRAVGMDGVARGAELPAPTAGFRRRQARRATGLRRHR